MPDPNALRAAAVTTAQSLPRRALMRALGATLTQESLELRSTAGYRLFGRVWRPERAGPHPAVLLCPGTNDAGEVFEGWTQPVNAREIAAMGFVVAHFDPAGRGRSWGEEDYGGPEHQDNVRVALRALAAHPQVDPTRVLVVSISLGLAMACGALADWADGPAVTALIDWEGPCDREIITAGGARLVPAMGHGLDDEFYWTPREATRHIGRLRCGYLRVQSARDHAQPGELRHAERMIQAASRGDLPWYQLNDHPVGAVPQNPEWIPPGRARANRALLRAIRRLSQ
ncbi:MAG: hypothetical protein IPN01_34325 [Deltaproteobacteria bacterium]|nr:hypothetical protein [Deltaproteobacteria bacterium]